MRKSQHQHTLVKYFELPLQKIFLLLTPLLTAGALTVRFFQLAGASHRFYSVRRTVHESCPLQTICLLLVAAQGAVHKSLLPGESGRDDFCLDGILVAAPPPS